jgi:hypothetical protein
VRGCLLVLVDRRDVQGCVPGRRAPDIVYYLITSDSTAFVGRSLLHFGGLVPSDDQGRAQCVAERGTCC